MIDFQKIFHDSGERSLEVVPITELAQGVHNKKRCGELAAIVASVISALPTRAVFWLGMGLLLNCQVAMAVNQSTDSVASAQSAASHGVDFLEEQVSRGLDIYKRECLSCHGPTLRGTTAGTALAGREFENQWLTGQRKLGDLHYLIATLMPYLNQGSLSAKENFDVTAYVLSENGYIPGRTALTADTLDAVLPPTRDEAEELPDATVKTVAPEPGQPLTSKTHRPSLTDRPDDSDMLADDGENWLRYNNDYEGRRFSPLTQINVQNVSRLAPVCVFQAGEIAQFQASPVIFEGTLYVTTGYNTYAVDAHTCEKKWQHVYQSDSLTPVTVARGAALYKGKVFRVTPDGHLLALDAKTGELLWDTWMSDASKGYWLSAAPIAYQDRVFIGEAGADWGVDGHIYAFDANTGKTLWVFDTVLSDDAGHGSANYSGGSTWSSFSFDVKANLLYAPIGNVSPDFNDSSRPGANLYTNSVVALAADSGKIAWWAQQVPRDVHDWDTAAAPALYEQSGKKYSAVAGKAGWLYIYDRDSHALVTKSEISSRKNAELPITPEGVHVCPGIMGGSLWNGPAYSPASGMLFVNSTEWCGTFKVAEARRIEGSAYYGGNHVFDEFESTSGWTRAFDAEDGKQIWAIKTKRPMLAGLTPTGGGVVFTGDLSGYFLAIDAKTGNILYRFNTGGAIIGGVSTYMVEGKQYVAATSGNSAVWWHTNTAATVFIFSLPPG